MRQSGAKYGRTGANRGAPEAHLLVKVLHWPVVWMGTAMCLYEWLDPSTRTADVTAAPRKLGHLNRSHARAAEACL